VPDCEGDVRRATRSASIRLSTRAVEDAREMRGQLGIIVEAISGHRISPVMISSRTRAYDSLDVPLAHLFADETLFMLVPHMLEQLVRREEGLVAELPEVGGKRSAEPVVKRVRLLVREAAYFAHRMRRTPSSYHLFFLFAS
jgi:hypothetical protein